MDLGFKIVRSAQVWAGLGAHHRKRSLVQNQIIERVVYSNNLSIDWFSYCHKLNCNSYLDSLVRKECNIIKKVYGLLVDRFYHTGILYEIFSGLQNCLSKFKKNVILSYVRAMQRKFF